MKKHIYVPCEYVSYEREKENKISVYLTHTSGTTHSLKWTSAEGMCISPDEILKIQTSELGLRLLQNGEDGNTVNFPFNSEPVIAHLCINDSNGKGKITIQGKLENIS